MMMMLNIAESDTAAGVELNNDKSSERITGIMSV
jgi:hypothetical protein